MVVIEEKDILLRKSLSTIGSVRARQPKAMMPSSTGGMIKDMGMVRDSSANNGMNHDARTWDFAQASK